MATTNLFSHYSNDIMTTLDENQEKQQHSPAADGEEEFRYEEYSLKVERSLNEEEESSEPFQDRTETDPPAVQRPSSRNSITHQQPSIIHFLRSFLFQYGMTETMECFQTEWDEMVQRGPVDVGLVPDVYTENQRLESELKNARRDREEYRQTASVAADLLLGVQRSRDSHRLKHKRVLQEKNRLIEEMKRLQLQCDDYEATVKRKNEKYQAALKQVMVMEKDKAFEETSASLQVKSEQDAENPETVTQSRPLGHKSSFN